MRGQFEIKILIVRGHSDIDTTYFIWIIGKDTRSRWVDLWVRGTVRWYWSADTLFWQLSIYHNIDVQLVFSWAPKLAKTLVSLWWGRTVAHSLARSVYDHAFLGWVDLLNLGLRPRAALRVPLSEFKKIKLEPTIIWKLVNCQRITSKNTQTR